MGKLKHFMSSKYPQKKIKEIQEQVEEKIQEEESINGFFTHNRKRRIKISLFLGILFYILSLPGTYKLMGSILNNVPGFGRTVSDDICHKLNWKIVLVHSLVFTVVTYLMLEFMENQNSSLSTSFESEPDSEL